jgi:hypothetical protein
MNKQLNSTITVLCFILSLPAAGDEANLAVNDPDQFAWHLLAAVGQPADNSTHQSLWQTWAEQSTVYASACQKPQWPGLDAAEPPAHGSRLVDILKNQGVSEDPFNALTGACNLQQVKINRPFFNYVVDHDLWYQEGVIRQASTEGIDFPADAVVFKADWTLISTEDKPRYHWREVSLAEYQQAFGQTSDCIQDLPDTEMLVLGLDAFHIVSRAVPNWVWTTWNHADTLGRCDYIGCRDDFGSDPAYIPPHREMGRPYDPGKLTPAALRVLAAAGLDEAWRHYRLMGTQVSFTDLTGRPTLLGNAVLEPSFGNTSSCATCHSMASYSAAGTNLDFLKSTQPFEGFVGTPDPSWFFPAQTGRPATPIVYQTDFMWQLATETKSRKQCCEPTGSPDNRGCSG